MTTPSPTSRRTPARPPRARPHTRQVLAGTVQLTGRILQGLTATAVLAAMLVGLPWGLVHFIGWPLPRHIPTWPKIQTVLLSPMTTQFLLDLLACLLWLLWAKFTLDVLICVPGAVRDTHDALDAAAARRDRAWQPPGPLHTIAGLLIGAIVFSLFGHRTAATAPSGAATTVATLTLPSATAPLIPGPPSHTGSAVDPPTDDRLVDRAVAVLPSMADADNAAAYDATPESDVVRLPHNGIHDSLWRIAARRLGDPTRWPEIWALNENTTMVDGRVFTNPNYLRPGWILRLPPPPASGPSTTPGNSTRPTTPLSTPDTAPPSSTPAPPATTTSPAPTRTPTTGPITLPSTAAPAPHTQGTPTGTSPPGRPARPARHGSGLELPSGAFVSLALAGAVTTAMASVWIWRRRRYRIGSGARADLNQPVAPVVRALRRAHEDALDTDTNLDGDPEELTLKAPYDATPGPTHPAPDRTITTRLGTRRGREVALDLAGTHGLGLTGPGASRAARALLVALLTDNASPGRDPQGTRVLIPATDVADLLDVDRSSRLPNAMRITRDLDTALDELEALLLTRTRHTLDSATQRDDTHREDTHCEETGRRDMAAPPVILVAVPAPHAERRLQAILDNGQHLGLSGVLLGQWRPGATVRVRDDGTIGAASPSVGDALAGTRLFTLPAPETADLLVLLHAAEGGENPEPTGPEDTHDDIDEPAHADGHHDARPPTLSTSRGRAPLSGPRAGGRTPGRTGDHAPTATRVGASRPRIASTSTDRPDPRPGRDTAAKRTPPARPVHDERTDTLSATSRAVTDSQTTNNGDHPDPGHQATGSGTDQHNPDHDRSGHEQAKKPDTAVTRPALSLTVLGHVTLTWIADGQRDLTGVLTRKQRELVVYLALHPAGVRRDTLNEDIWPGGSPARPFNSFYNTLSQLRRDLSTATHGQISEITQNHDGRYRLNPHLMAVDYWQLHNTLAQRRHTRNEPDQLAELHEAIALYHGDLAADLTPEWIEPHRETTRRDVLDALDILIRAHRDHDPETTLELLEQARHLDPCNEELYRRIIRVQARLGRHESIPRTIALLTTILARDGHQPSSTTLHLADTLQHLETGVRPLPHVH